MYIISIYPSSLTGNTRTLTLHIYNAPSKQAALRRAFRILIKEGRMKRQPATDHSSDSTFKGVSIEYNPLKQVA